MGLQLDQNLIRNFRDSVNQNDFILSKFKEIDGKNKLNIIYSSMDWLNVVVEGLASIEIKEGGLGYNHVNTISLMQYLVTIDLITESIKQLYRVLDDLSNYPFKDSNIIFNQKNVNDDDYFKHLRAVFSTHPVNLTSIDGIQRHDGVRYFASWASSGRILGYDFIVSLYSNDPRNDVSNFVGINIKEVNEFAITRYSLLKNLIEISDKMTLSHIEKMKGNDIEQVKILIQENNIRYRELKGFWGIITYIDFILSCEMEVIDFESFDKSIIEEYLLFIKSLIPVIKENLQAMNVIPISKEIKLFGYEFEKIYMYLGNGEHQLGKIYFYNLVEYGDLPKEFLEQENIPLFSLVFDAYVHFKTKELGRAVLYSDIVPEEHLL